MEKEQAPIETWLRSSRVVRASAATLHVLRMFVLALFPGRVLGRALAARCPCRAGAPRSAHPRPTQLTRRQRLGDATKRGSSAPTWARQLPASGRASPVRPAALAARAGRGARSLHHLAYDPLLLVAHQSLGIARTCAFFFCEDHGGASRITLSAIS
ncbi:unnamed protein product [Prorocentrum cordatum]|uniref:Uncharacterized protein n=1 Tax=Prorocentrum cordatum TaxID=2364126 RepID=A0ABN9T0Z3_9DINO|nr:unnamed protein product [Polarella glacialis]